MLSALQVIVGITDVAQAPHQQSFVVNTEGQFWGCLNGYIKDMGLPPTQQSRHAVCGHVEELHSVIVADGEAAVLRAALPVVVGTGMRDALSTYAASAVDVASLQKGPLTAELWAAKFDTPSTTIILPWLPIKAPYDDDGGWVSLRARPARVLRRDAVWSSRRKGVTITGAVVIYLTHQHNRKHHGPVWCMPASMKDADVTLWPTTVVDSAVKAAEAKGRRAEYSPECDGWVGISRTPQVHANVLVAIQDWIGGTENLMLGEQGEEVLAAELYERSVIARKHITPHAWAGRFMLADDGSFWQAQLASTNTGEVSAVKLMPAREDKPGPERLFVRPTTQQQQATTCYLWPTSQLGSAGSRLLVDIPVIAEATVKARFLKMCCSVRGWQKVDEDPLQGFPEALVAISDMEVVNIGNHEQMVATGYRRTYVSPWRSHNSSRPPEHTEGSWVWSRLKGSMHRRRAHDRRLDDGSSPERG